MPWNSSNNDLTSIYQIWYSPRQGGCNDLMDEHAVKYYIVNLPWANERREFMEEQARSLGLKFEIIPAISGKELTDEDLACYDSKKRSLYMPSMMSRNEIACVISHRTALKTFVESGAKYGIILEDDALLMPNFLDAVQELTQHLHGWEVAKLYTIDGKLYPIKSWTKGVDMPIRVVFPKKILWGTLAYMYTQDGAKQVYEALEKFWRPSDPQIADILLRNKIPTIGVAPSPVGLSELNKCSCIDADSLGRGKKTVVRRSLVKYLRYRFYIFIISCFKLRMRLMMRRRLWRE